MKISPNELFIPNNEIEAFDKIAESSKMSIEELEMGYAEASKNYSRRKLKHRINCMSFETRFCPGCGEKMELKGYSKYLVLTIFGEIELNQPIYECCECKIYIRPLEELLCQPSYTDKNVCYTYNKMYMSCSDIGRNLLCVNAI